MINGITKFSLEKKKIRNGYQQTDTRQALTVYALRPFWSNYENFLTRIILVDYMNYDQPFTRILLTCGRPNPMMPYCLYRIVRSKADYQKRPFSAYSQTTSQVLCRWY